MSRTRKDEPEFVKKLKHGITVHDENCARRDSFYNQNRIVHFDAIFYAHEVPEIEAFEAKLTEENTEFSVSEKKGYLFTFSSDSEYWWRRVNPTPSQARSLFKDFVNFDRESIETEAIGVQQYIERTDTDFYFQSSYVRTKKINIFKIYSVDLDLGKFKHHSNRQGVYANHCCEPELPAKMKKNRRDCSCCFIDEENLDSKTDLRTSLTNAIKAFNSGDLDSQDSIEEEHNNHFGSSRI